MQVDFTTVTWPLYQLVIVMIVVFFLGALLGFYSFSSETKQKLRDAELKAEVAVRQAKMEADRAAAEARAAQPAAPQGKNLLRLWLDESQRPRLEIDGQTAEATPISETNRKRLIMLLNILRPWVETKPSATPPPAPVADSPSPFFSSPAPAPASAPLPAKKDEKPAAPLSMVAQIDEILQARLASSSLSERAIKLMESPEGTVIVMVGLQKFDGVGEVTDPQIQSEIRAAIEAWEKKYTPGL